MPTYPLATLAPTVNSAGISAPSYNDILLSLQASYKAIYGSDIVLSADSQDGQWIAVQAKAIHDNNQIAILIFNSMSPSYSQGAQLSSLVKLSAISRNVSSNSTAVGTVVGVSGTVIQNGVVRDVNGNLWNLPSSVTIPVSGSIAVTVTSQTTGSIVAQVGDISQIANPQYGWQSFSNTSAATAGAPVETDAALRRRQAVSTALPALGIIAAIYSAVGNVLGVTRWYVYENATGSTDTNGIPAHSICVVVEGGTTTAIAAAIAARKPPGIQTYGTTAVTVKDAVGLTSIINYDVLAYLQVYMIITIQSLTGYTATIGTEIVTGASAFVNGLAIGESAYYSQINAAASLINSPDGQTYFIQSLIVGTVSFTGRIDNGTPGNAGTLLTVSAMASGSAPLTSGQSLFGLVSGVAAGTVLGSQVSGVTGGAGVYNVNVSQSVASEGMIAGAGAGVSNVVVPFNQAAQCPSSNVTLVVH